MASTVYPVALSHFAVFCPALGPDEDNTHEQLLFYAGAVLPPFYPYSANDYYARTTHLRRRSSGGSNSSAITPTSTPAGGGGGSVSFASTTKPLSNSRACSGERVVSLDMKLREIGLAAALVTFGNSFGTNKSKFHVVHSEKRRTVVFEPERGVLMQLSVVLPRRVRPYAGGSSKEKDAYSIEFLDSELSDEAMRAWVESEYWAFRILFGPLSRALNSGSGGGGEQQKQTVRRQLDAFFGRTLWRWDRRWRSELDLIHALRPLPQMPLGSISLGGFEQLWRALSELLPPPPSPPASDDCAADDERRPLVAAAVVLWRGREVLWSSCGLAAGGDQIHVLRALAAWSRAALAPAFSGGPPPSRRPRAAANPITPSASASVSASVSASMPATATGGSSSWLWGWRAKPDAAAAAAATPKLALHTSGSAESCSAESSSGDGSDDGGGAGGGAGGGIAQALSRAVNALVEPRPPTPPEVDPVFASTCEAGQYALSASDIADSNHERRWASSGGGALFADSDAESLRSVSSVQTTRTAATVAVSRHSASARMEPALSAAGEGRRTRSTTVQSSSAAAPPYAQAASRSAYWPMALGRGGLAQRAHGRSPSIMSTASIATVESTQLRDDTRVSARSWWPSVLGGSWGSSAAKMPEPAPLRTTAPLSDDSADEPQSALLSGIDVSTTFLYTGEHAFPGLSAAQPSAAAAAEPQPQQPLQHSNGAEYIRVVEGGGEEDDDDEEPQGERREATVSRLESAMDEGMPAAYAHGVDVDPERGVVLAPRGLSGMQYDTRLLKLMFQGTSDIPTTAPERPLYVSPDSQDGACKTLVYKYGDFVFVLLGPPTSAALPPPPTTNTTTTMPASSSARRRGGRRRKRVTTEPVAPVQRSGHQAVLRYRADEAQAIEGVVLQYAASLQAAAARDTSEVLAQRRSEAQLALHRRIPPYLFQERSQHLTRTNWRQQDVVVALNRSYAGFYSTTATTTTTKPLASSDYGERKGGRRSNNGNCGEEEEEKEEEDVEEGEEKVNPAPSSSLPANVSRTLSVVNAEITNNRNSNSSSNNSDIAVCVRMQDKGWVAAASFSSSSSLLPGGGGSECYCVVDQPKATLADAQTFLSKLSKRASSFIS